VNGSDEVLIALEDVAVAFGGLPIFERLTFATGRGEFLCLLGPSGCGKSTTLRLIAGLLAPSAGRIWVHGGPPEANWRRLAFVFQSPRLLPWRTALENVRLGIELRAGRSGRADAAGRARRYLRMVGLAEDAAKFPAQLSGGERQRVALARALAVEPEVILMDEPLAALDVRTREHLRAEIIWLWKATGTTILFVTHDLDEALFLADRILVLSQKPTRILRDLPVPLPRPRDLFRDEAIGRLRTEIRALFREEDEDRGLGIRAGQGEGE
jgi:NitT/TauT family transport system ATP-binding protein